MNSNLPIDVAEALREINAGEDVIPRSMPAPFYTDPCMLSLEIEHVFLNGWICVGRGDEIPQPGDYTTLDLFDEAIVVVRNNDGGISAMSNVCRHRGSQLLTGTGQVRRITCPYHRWSYALDGELLHAPLVDKTGTFNKAECRLPSFQLVDWMGWLFINLDGKADDFHEKTSGLNSYVENYHTEEMRTVEAIPENWPLNWKILAENFMEGYHLTPVHRHTLHPMTPTRLCEKIPGRAGYTGYKSHYSESFEGRKPYHPDMTAEECSQSMMVWIYPGFVAAISPNSAVFMSITPTGPESLQTRWGVIARDVLFESDEAQARVEFARQFNAEDRERLLAVQKGLRSRFVSRGFLAPADYEGTVWDFYRYMACVLKAQI